MATIMRRGQLVETVGELPEKGEKAPDFVLVKPDLSELRLDDFKGRRIILNIFPSIDTPTCASSVREFNKRAASADNATVICVSADLPFALGRFCGAEGIENVMVASSFRSSFGKDYQVTFTSGPLTGLLSRAIVVIGGNGNILHTEQVPDTSQQPDYNKALAVLDITDEAL